MRLKYRCQRTGREVLTSIETDASTLVRMQRMKVAVWCPHCSKPHQIKGAEAYLDAAPDYVEASVASLPVPTPTDESKC